jgi:hypothetical protein
MRMQTQTNNEIYVPALMDGDRIIVPEVWLGRDVEYRKDRDNHALTAVAYNEQMQLPALAELRRAFFDKNPIGSWVSPEYKESVLSKRGCGEWTSTFLRDGKEAIERPEKVFYDEKHKLWVAEGGKVKKVELPFDGWTLEYDKPTGFPSRTSQNRKHAERVFGNDTSYFYASKNGLRAVSQHFSFFNYGPFSVDASCAPDYWYSYFGSHSCRRSEQDAQRLATPVYVMNQKEYDILVEVSTDDARVRELLSKIRVRE